MARKIEVSLEADTSDFEQGMKSAESSVDRLDKTLDAADRSSDRFAGGLDKLDGGLSNTTDKFRATNDLAGGLGAILGIEGLDAVTGYATGIADMADGLGGLLVPALAKGQAAFAAMNATLLANPIFLVVAALTALAVAFVVAYKKSETFRNIVHGALDGVKKVASAFLGAIGDSVKKAASVIGSVADIITKPYQIAFKAIAGMWNATLGGFGISVPGFSIPFGPSFGGLNFTIPNMPTFRAAGGPLNANQAAIVGERGPELFIPSGAGTVVPNGAMGGVTIQIATGASDLDELIRKRVRVLGNGNVQTAFGRT